MIRLLLLALALFAAWPAQATSLRSGWYAGEPQQFMRLRQGRETLTGLDIEMVRAIAARAGHDIRFEAMAYPALMAAVAADSLDFATGIAASDERRAAFRLSQPYRHDIDVLIVRRGQRARMQAADAAGLLAGLQADGGFRLGIRAGFSYVLPALDGFLAERLSIALLIAQSGARPAVEEAALRLPVPLHLIFAPAVPDTTVTALDAAIAALAAEGALDDIAARFRAPVLLALTLGSEWLAIIEVLGIAAGALAGYLAARQAQFSLLGALVLATLGALGGGMVRDLLISRQPIAMVANPHYLMVVIGTVATAYGLGVAWAALRGRAVMAFALAQGMAWLRRRDLPNLAFEAVDAAALGLFMATGVAIALGLGVTPLWLWGPILGMLTGAGGGILRDIVRGSGVRNLRDGLYAEVALAWALALSLHLMWRSHAIEQEEMLLLVIASIAGTAATRMAVVLLRLRPPGLP
jgi:polar amino acid transport system substrate-binding protein